MKSLFHDYRFALLDASLFTCKLSESLRCGLKEIPVYAAQTFDAEVAQYLQVLPAKARSVYCENLQVLMAAVQAERMNLDQYESVAREFHSDTWGVINLLTRLGSQFVLITADQLLIQRVILEELKVDIYALNQPFSWDTTDGREGFLRWKEFPSLKPKFELREDVPWPAGKKHEFMLKENAPLYREDGRKVLLGKEINHGNEAWIFRVQGDPGQAAKIFRENELPPKKFSNILAVRGANKVLDVPWALFPRDILYYDPQCRIPAGFTEGLAASKGDLDDHPLYGGDLSDLEEEYLETRVTQTLEICIRIVRQARYLNVYGFLPSDFTAGNFAVTEDEDNGLQMWDTDSFGYGSYYSDFYSGNRGSREYDTSRKLGAVGFCCEEMYLLVFCLLSLGDYPIHDQHGTFKYADPDYEAMFRKTFFPGNLWNHFASVYADGKEPSAAMLLHELHTALEVYKSNRALDKSYGELLEPIFAAYEEYEEEEGGGHGGSSGNDDKGPEEETGKAPDVPEDDPEDDPPENKLPDWAIILGVAAAVMAAAFFIGQL